MLYLVIPFLTFATPIRHPIPFVAVPDDESIGIGGAEDVDLGSKGSQQLSLLSELPTPTYVKRIGN